MEWKLGYGAMGLIAILLCSGLIFYQIQNAPTEVPPQISFASKPVLNPNPELEGLRVYVNTASIEDLQQLPEIGPAKAKAIHAYVRRYGRIIRAEQMLEIEGIGESVLEQILPYLAFE